MKAADLSSHLGERGNDPFHGTLLYGGVSGQGAGKGLGSQDAGDQADGGAAVSAVQYVLRRH